MVDAMHKIAPRIVDYRDFTRELSALSREAYGEGRLLHGALFLRSAEFYMFRGDAAKHLARRQFVTTMREVFGVAADAYHKIPYEAGRLFAYRFTPRSPKSTIVVFGGFDSYIEELIPTALFLRDAGYDVVAFEGPGQGAALEEERLPFTAEWRRPVAAVLNYFRVEDVTLLGYSLGGGLAVRAAAYEPRVSRVVCDDILVNFHPALLRQLPPTKRRLLDALMTARASTLVNALLGAAMRSSLVIDWGMKQGMHSTGTSSPYDFLRAEMRFETMSVSGMLTQDVLLMAGAEDHYVPLEQFSQQLRLLTKVRSVTARLFTRAEQAQNHVQVGDIGLSLDVIVTWLGGLEARDRHIGAHPAAGDGRSSAV
jgi:pimeloyl-ACP methyl ester carboxylesterase